MDTIEIVLDILLIVVLAAIPLSWIYVSWKIDKAVDRYTAELARSKDQQSTTTPLNTVDQ